MATRIAALHGLILVLVYVQELGDYQDIRKALTQEAGAVADVWNDARRYGGLEPIQNGLARYVDIVLREERDRLGNRQGLSASAWQAWESV